MNLPMTSICSIYIESRKILTPEPVYKIRVGNALPNINLEATENDTSFLHSDDVSPPNDREGFLPANPCGVFTHSAPSGSYHVYPMGTPCSQNSRVRACVPQTQEKSIQRPSGQAKNRVCVSLPIVR